jgi:hypothetical protein
MRDILQKETVIRMRLFGAEINVAKVVRREQRLFDPLPRFDVAARCRPKIR